MNWEIVHHLADLTGLATIIWGIVYHRIQKWRQYRFMIEEDHRKVIALWREHGYNGWDGAERRKELR